MVWLAAISPQRRLVKWQQARQRLRLMRWLQRARLLRLQRPMQWHPLRALQLLLPLLLKGLLLPLAPLV